MAAAKERGSICAAIEPDIDIAVARDFHRGDAGNRSGGLDEIGGNFLRRLLQTLRELECDRDSDFTERGLAWLFEREGRIDAETRAKAIAESRVDGLFEIVEHGNLSIRSGCVALPARAVLKSMARDAELTRNRGGGAEKIKSRSCRKCVGGSEQRLSD